MAGEARRLVGRDRLAVVLVVGLIGAVLLAAPLIGSQSAPGSSAPGSSASNSAGVSPAAEWGAVGLSDLRPRATLQPTLGSAGQVQADTAFVLATLDGSPAADLARGLTITPAAAFTVTATERPERVLIQPVTPLAAGRTYRVAARAADGSLAGSWAFRSDGPLHVVGTLPGDASTGAPTDTGVEVTFDQDGVTDAAAHFEIQPTTQGSFEMHGRTLVFVPAGDLAPRRLYAVTIHKGVGLAGSSQILERDLTFRFETGAATPDEQPPSNWLPARSVIESGTADAPLLGLQATGDLTMAPKRLPVEVYRYADASSALSALKALLVAPTWALYGPEGQLPTTGLARVATFTAAVEALPGESRYVRFPGRLEAGWYLVVLKGEGRDAQAFLQVTDVATYSAAATDRLLTWVNDLRAQAPLAGALVTLDGTTLGATDTRGVSLVPTPAQVASPDGSAAVPVLEVRAADGRVAFVPLGLVSSRGTYLPELYGSAPWPGEGYWLLLYTDRTLYRQTDVIDAWGLLRDRATGLAPAGVELRLVAGGDYAGYATRDQAGADAPPIATARPTLSAAGAYAATLPLKGLPLGDYSVQLWGGGKLLASTGIRVDVIRKPAFRLDLTTDRHVLLDGDRVRATVAASFFDGTPAPDVALSIGGFGDRRATTNGAGVATVSSIARWDAQARESWMFVEVPALATQPEVGQISTSQQVLVFPSSAWVQASAVVRGGHVVVAGTVNTVDVARLEASWPRPVQGDFDPRGAALKGVRVTAAVAEQVPHRTLRSRWYDFITKRVVDEYDYTYTEQAIATRSLVSDGRGGFELDLPVPNPDHSYVVRLRVVDRAGRAMEIQVWASPAGAEPASYVDTRPRIALGSACAQNDAAYDIGDPIHATICDGRGPLPAGEANRYLFAVAQQGFREIALQDGPSWSRPFAAADAPDITLLAVRFTGATYTAATSTPLTLDAASRAVRVAVTADRARYAPGDPVTLQVRTTDATGRAAPAAVIVRVVDQKLFQIGGASDNDPLLDLYGTVTSGFLASYASHAVPFPGGGGWGDTGGGGGGGRDDFRDTAFFRQIATDASGRATVSFSLPDDLTAWRVGVAALSEGLGAGTGTIVLPAGLPFFVEPTLAPEYLLADRPTLRLRAFGTALHAGDKVTFTVSSSTLPMAAVTVTGRAFTPVALPLPALALGSQALRIEASTGTGSAALQDVVTQRFQVVASRLSRVQTGYAELVTGLTLEGGDGLTTYVFSDAGRGRFVPLLEALASAGGARLDQQLAADVARRLLIDRFGRARGDLPAGDFDAQAFQHEGGLVLLPYGSTDLETSAWAALVAADRFDASRLQGFFEAARSGTAATRERRVIALAGLAALGEPVLGEIRTSAANPELTIRERLWVALAAEALGDDATALAIERALLTSDGQQLGRWVRLRVGDSVDDTLTATAMLAVVAAGLGDPLAVAAQAYVAETPSGEQPFVLQQAAYVQRLLERTPAPAASFAYTVDGVRRQIDLAAGASYTVSLTAAQRRTLGLERVSGQVAVAVSWEAPFAPSAAQLDPDLQLRRAAAPASPVPAGHLVVVTLTATFGRLSPTGACYETTELVPSGLAPVDTLQAWPDDVSEAARGVVLPYRIAGQRVSFCVSPGTQRNAATMRYFARVVTPGTYRWEPAIMQSTSGGASLVVTPASVMVVR